MGERAILLSRLRAPVTVNLAGPNVIQYTLMPPPTTVERVVIEMES